MNVTEAIGRGLLEEVYEASRFMGERYPWYKGYQMTKKGRKTALSVAKATDPRAAHRWDDGYLLELLLSSAADHRDTGSGMAA